MIRLVVIGCGKIADYVIKGILKTNTYSIEAICDISLDRLKAFSWLNTKTYTDYKEMLRQEENDYVVLLTHHYGRLSLILELLRNHHKVICEKPVVACYSEFEKLRDVCYETGNYPYIMYHRTYNKIIKNVYNLLDHEDVLKIYVNYLEDISQHTSDSSYLQISDTEGGGCVCDNFPNSTHFLFKYGNLDYKDSFCKLSKNKKYTALSDIELVLNQKTPCYVHLDWDSPIDTKNVVIETKNEKYYFDMGQDYEVKKDVLIDEYAEFFGQLDYYEPLKELPIAEKILLIEKEVFSKN